ncbi:MAG: response regulator [Bacteroidales bacterium]|nr:response regulator [Bacteroidales bacterium]
MDKKIQQVPQKVMIIDDDPFSVMLSKLKLKKFVDEKNFIEFYDTQNALGYLGQILGSEAVMIPDLILLEVMMNDATGWDFIPQFNDLMMKYNNVEIQLIILTSSQFFSDYRRALKYKSVKGFMMKPFRSEILLDVYQNAIAGKVGAQNEIYQSFIV